MFSNVDEEGLEGTAGPSSDDFRSPKRRRSGSGWCRSLGATGMGKVWCEVFCGSAEEGKWVHVDALLGWIDRCRLECSTAGRLLSQDALLDSHVKTVNMHGNYNFAVF